MASQLEMKLPVLKVVLKRLEDMNSIDFCSKPKTIYMKKKTIDDLDIDHDIKMDILEANAVNMVERFEDEYFKPLTEIKEETLDIVDINCDIKMDTLEPNGINVEDKIENEDFKLLIKIEEEALVDLDTNRDIEIDPLETNTISVEEKFEDKDLFKPLIKNKEEISNQGTEMNFLERTIDVEDQIGDNDFCNKLMEDDNEVKGIVHNQHIKTLQGNDVHILEEEKHKVDNNNEQPTWEDINQRELKNCKRKNTYISKECSSLELTSSGQIFTGSQCAFKTDLQRNLKRHMLTHSGENPCYCHDCIYITDADNNFTAPSNKLNLEIDILSNSQCIYKTSNIDSKDMQTHIEEVLISGQCFTNTRNHMQIQGKETQVFSCNHCTYTTGVKRFLMKHIQNHWPDKKFECSQCCYKTNNKQYLVRHIETHRKDKPFKCSHCPYTTVKRSYLNKHMKTHNEEKPFKCSHCPYKATNKYYVMRHVMKHVAIHSEEKPLHCSQCSYKTTFKQLLILHVQIHRKDKPFTCSQCPYNTVRKKDFVEHKLTHEAEKPFNCSQCPFNTVRKRGLVQHMKSHK